MKNILNNKNKKMLKIFLSKLFKKTSLIKKILNFLINILKKLFCIFFLYTKYLLILEKNFFLKILIILIFLNCFIKKITIFIFYFLLYLKKVKNMYKYFFKLL